MRSKLIYCFVRHGLGPLCHFNFMILWMDQPPTSKFQNWFMISSTMSLKKCRWDLPGWWFGTCFMTFHILECHHPNWLMFFRGVETNQWYPGIDSGGKRQETATLIGNSMASCRIFPRPILPIHLPFSSHGIGNLFSYVFKERLRFKYMF